MLVLALSLPALPAAGQATITVDTTADTAANDGFCTLREAITAANTNTASGAMAGECAAGTAPADTIEFNISGGGSLATIQPTSQLPTITEGVTIDGTTQCAGSVPCIELDGTSAGTGINGLVITGSNSTIRGLVINLFDDNGVEVSGSGATGNTIVGNYIGTDAAGTAALGNTGHGVSIEGGAANNTIGGTVAGARNVISGNNHQGVRIDGSGTEGNLVQGNFIGTDVTGTADVGNSFQGVIIRSGAANNTIGGTAAGARNVISGNTERGVLILGSDNNTVEGNFIGTDVTGTADLGNNRDGVLIVTGATGNTIGGTAAGARNVISGNRAGVQIDGSGTTGNQVQGNFIGTDVTGTVALGNSFPGVLIVNGATGNTIGGTAAGARNVISGNSTTGVRIQDTGTEGNQVQGNFIGTDSTGTAALGNGGQGVLIRLGASNNTVGGTAVGARNVISGNEADGVLLGAPGGNQVQGNYIGTDANGTANLGNTGRGVSIEGGATGNMIGGAAAGAGNVISGNDDHGIIISASDSNTVAGNYIGTDGTGATALGNTGHGVSISTGAANNTIGGAAAGARNVISGNDDHGVRIDDASASNTVAGNYIGTDGTGTAALGNIGHGVLIEGDATGNMIGGTAAGARNVISGNNDHGIIISASDDNTVAGNYIGTDITGAAALGNTGHGVRITSSATGNTIGGTAAGARNVVSGNDEHGVRIDDASDNNTVASNFIGTDVTGTAALGNTGHGVSIEGGATGNMIGGTVAGAGNVVSGNDESGIIIGASANNTVAGNYIGTGANGTNDLGNTGHGMVIFAGATGNTIGGTTAGARNLISGNNLSGVFISASTSNTVAGNFIGTDGTGTAALGNTLHGVLISDDATGNTIGGTGAGAGNTIAFNANDGIAVTGSASTGNALHANATFQNGDLGIDLGDDGATPNDPGDGDGSPNKLQNFPALTAAVIDGSGDLMITYLVDTDPANATYDLVAEFFEADAFDEEGQTFLGSDTYTTTDHSGCGPEPCTKTVNLGNAAGLGESLVATATDDDGNTSEFSAPFVTGTVTRYVATTGSDTANDCIDALNPCATIAHAVGQANAGDTIDIAAGTYTEPGLIIEKRVVIRGQGVIVQ